MNKIKLIIAICISCLLIGCSKEIEKVETKNINSCKCNETEYKEVKTFIGSITDVSKPSMEYFCVVAKDRDKIELFRLKSDMQVILDEVFVTPNKLLELWESKDRLYYLDAVIYHQNNYVATKIIVTTNKNKISEKK